jgi:TonB family protein
MLNRVELTMLSHTKSLTLLLVALSIVTGAIVTAVRADSWALPEKKKYYSRNKKYYLEVIPKQLESQLKYFEDKVANKENAGARPEVKDNHAKGVLFARRTDGTYSKKWEFPLVNEVSPVSAIVSESGEYCVTFDNWHSVGYGDDVVVIYRANGSVVKKFSLEDLLTEGDISVLPHSVSSIWWGGEHYIDEAKGLLILKVTAERQDSDNPKFLELKIELASGRPLEPKRDRLPQDEFRVEAGTAPDNFASRTGQSKCTSADESFEANDFTRVTSDQLYSRIKAHPMPPYPPIAKAAHAGGEVVVELLVSKSGDVLCARALSGHPLLQGAAVAATLNWKFYPIEISSMPAKVAGTVTITFGMGTKNPN